MSGPGVSRQQPIETYRASIVTSDATPTAAFSLPLATGWSIGIACEAVCVDAGVAHRAEFRARNLFSRTAGGTSSRDGTTNGVQDSVANTFTGPRPSLTFGDPSASHAATVIVTGKAGVTIRWTILIVVTRAQG